MSERFSGYLVKCAIFNAVKDLEALEAEHEISVKKLGKAVEHVTAQQWYGFIARVVRGDFDSWERKEYGRKLSRGFLTQYARLHGYNVSMAQ
jgi:hypothetical protein